MTITFIGHGYVGLVTAAVFADLGNTVWVVGRTKEKIENLKRGVMPFYEPGLEEMVKRNTQGKRLLFTLDYQEAVSNSEVVFIAVGTPPKKSGEADLSSVFAAAQGLSKSLDGYTVVVTKSTVPPGTNRKVGEIVSKMKPQKANFDIASIPEFLREGTALSDTLHPDRVVIGSDSVKARKILTDLHKPIDGKVVLTNIETAEMIKYASNSLLSTKISFAHAMAFLSERVGADVEDVLEGVGLDKRLGRAFLYPGVGYGGSCFPKDVRALIAIAESVKYDFKLLKAVDEINNQASAFFIKKIETQLAPIKGKNVGVLGLSFKPNTDDMREAPSVKIINALRKSGVKIKAFDPVAMTNAKKILRDIDYCTNAYDVAKDADAVVVLTEWNEFRQLDLLRLKSMMKTPMLFDGRNIYDPNEVKSLGFVYYGVGR
ncbi:MAG: UDP-glucose/GDP-mannose dehydrogenase family protein [Patescibacteria group bacterium]